jgi:endoglucanase
MNPTAVSRIFLIALVLTAGVSSWAGSDLHLTQQEVLERQGLSVLLFHNSYHRVFGDQKMSGMEIILHDQRIATNGDVRLSATPAQWDPIPEFKERKQGPAQDEIAAYSTYPDQGLGYRIHVRPETGGFRVAVQLERPIPPALVVPTKNSVRLDPFELTGSAV